MKIGVCGTGRMGSSIAQRLMSVGHEVGVWNRDAAKTKPLTEAGAKLFASPAELVDGCDAVVVMLLNDAATEAVYRGPNGILKAKLAGKLVIDMSTVRPDTMISIGTAVAARCCIRRMSGRRQHGARRKRENCSGWPEARRRMSPGRCRCSNNCAAASSMSESSVRARP